MANADENLCYSTSNQTIVAFDRLFDEHLSKELKLPQSIRF